MGKYFGTDGFRGEANRNLTADHAYKIGRFLGWYYGELKRQNGDDTPARIVIGKEYKTFQATMFEYTLVGGLVDIRCRCRPASCYNNTVCSLCGKSR